MHPRQIKGVVDRGIYVCFHSRVPEVPLAQVPVNWLGQKEL